MQVIVRRWRQAPGRVAARVCRLEQQLSWMETEGMLKHLAWKLRFAVESQRLAEFMERKAAAEAAARAKAERERVARIERDEKARAEAARLAALPPEPVAAAPVIAPKPAPKPEPPPSMDIPEAMQIRPIHWGGLGFESYDDDRPDVLTEYDPLAGCDDDYDSS